MKRLFTVVFITIITLTAHTQTIIPNPGFEQWTDVNTAANWNSTFSQTITYMNIPIPVNYVAAFQSTDAHSGNYSMKLTAQDLISILSIPLPGCAQLGHFNTAGITNIDTSNFDISSLNITNYISGGVPFNRIPDKITAWIKYMPDADTLHFIAVATRWNGTQAEVIAQGEYTTGETISNWTKVELPFNTLIENTTPDTLNIIFLTNDGISSSLVSELYLDDVELVVENGGETEIFDVTHTPMFNIFPNPTTDEIRLEAASTHPYQVRIFDANGQLVWSDNHLQNNVSIDVSDYAKGVYFLKIKQNDSVRLEKVVIQ